MPTAAAAIPKLRPGLAYVEPLVMVKHPLWYVKVEDAGDIWRGRFLHQPDAARIAEMVRYEAQEELEAAATLAATPDAPGSEVGGGPSNSELATGLLEFAARLEALAGKIQAGVILANVTVCDAEVFV